MGRDGPADDDAGGTCWSCGAPAAARRIEAETVIRGRAASEGGPYRVFRCPACRAENGVLAGPGGGRMLHPLSGLEAPSFLDRFLSGAERSRLAKARSWWDANRARVERFRRGIEEPRPRAPDGPRTSRRPPPRPRERPPATTGPRAVLGVPDDATAEEVRRAFRRLAKRHHPDRASDPGAAAERFRAIRAAYESILGELGG